jgi:microcystin-dependent protein
MFTEPYIATITAFGGNFAPAGWMFCQGQLLPIADYDVLFSLVGTTYGGDGQVTFALPDLRGRRPIHIGQSPGLPNYYIGEVSGLEQTTLLSMNLPVHNHTLPVLTGTPQGSTDTTGGVDMPRNTVVPAAGAVLYGTPAGSPMGPYSGNAITPIAGGNAPVPTIVPYLAMNYIIAIEGIYPSRS